MIIAATGHRPEKVGGYGEIPLARLQELARGYMRKMQPAQVISGMALGWDTAWALTALELKVPLIAAVPFRDQESRWPLKSRELYRAILEQAERVEIVCEGDYMPWKMQKRNEWMCDHADRVCALWNGSPGGTANCIRYAKSIGKSIDNLWEHYNVSAPDVDNGRESTSTSERITKLDSISRLD